MRLPEPYKIFMKMPEDKPNVIFWTKNYKEDLVILRKDDFYKLIEDYENKKNLVLNKRSR